MVHDDGHPGSVGDEPVPQPRRSKDAPLSPVAGDVTRILSQMEHGEGHAAEDLLPLVYDELRKLAVERMAQEKPGQTLQATALVHEAYLRLVDVKQTQHWSSRGHFFAAAAEAMRRILIEQARHKSAWAAGGHHERIGLSHVDVETETPGLDILALSESLEKLARVDPRAARLVNLRFFAGLSRSQAAEVLGVSISTVDTDWAYAKCWLQLELSGEGEPHD